MTIEDISSRPNTQNNINEKIDRLEKEFKEEMAEINRKLDVLINLNHTGLSTVQETLRPMSTIEGKIYRMIYDLTAENYRR